MLMDSGLAFLPLIKLEHHPPGTLKVLVSWNPHFSSSAADQWMLKVF